MDTDTQVSHDIVNEFKNSRILQHAQLKVHVEDGVVTISGRLNSFAERKTVERAVERVAGIKTLILAIRAAAFPTIAPDADSANDGGEALG